ncbi:hypothetical protein HYH03_005499 [Edaphochlamys debaryana]|uniref:Glutamine amidotransferase domain-containing protein n=1 Tax=Edaphochlamys debaryana TaxID=47281 RepID=A0A835Y8Q1_9CHLO|nr:hypothetical protein HYH03_005499 [Edaphochlamys debaryana]|eukprot:KAG2496266.1 hypothetical protein HYH03_005499 [Edaphochlamys debaryana]
MAALRVAVFSCEDAEHWRGYTLSLWQKALGRPGDTFTYFPCHRGEFPEVEGVRDRFEVIVVGGSHYNTDDPQPWIRRLEGLLPQYLAAGVRVVGCCFGHQILAQALGGQVGRNPSGRFVLGVEEIQVDVAAAEAAGLPLPSPAALDPAGPGSGPVQLRLLESHGDQVLQLPPGATLLASSGTARHEMFCAAGGMCLGFQFHPEFTPAIVSEKILPRVGAPGGRLSAEESAAAGAALTAADGAAEGAAEAVSTPVFLQALRAFVRSPAPKPSAQAGAADSAASAAEAVAAAAAAGAEAAAGARQALEIRAGAAAEAVSAHVRSAAAAGLAQGTLAAQLLTDCNREAAGAYSRAAAGAEAAGEKVATARTVQAAPLKLALGSLGGLEAQVDHLLAAVGGLELQAQALEAQLEAQGGQQQGQKQAT